ncbi:MULTISPECIES: N-acetylmuramoyl-L-alanine amidase CwlD [Tepidibacillus]|uniref:N-acetylmuramoyl-L-alanine amidase n=1 Tax=Tepidibacillus decaturensis TaxID=1413211 RepID=A0A135L7F6_9BACI|nr:MULTISPECIES: N-acetylmuramoyl-L-alanine amidase CwlD [Tepidibacillus]KXG44934.1 N-acetylmuramoyl-L-alanine amidase [Tepidibacillus decaturensis]GBF12073.1 germination-specific N-acetylmuramoyl-L-alanine amidase precursor [Tepidibacillus sp. HK-1]
MLKMKIVSFILALVLLITIMLYDVPINDSWSVWSLPLSGKILILDAGHGGPDGGAVSKDGIVEKDITLKITKYLQDYLNEAGALVIMTRESDVDLADEHTRGIANRKLEDLQNRVRLTNDSDADFFISIHLNSIPSEKWHGAQTFYYPIRSENEQMSRLIQEQLRINLKNTDRVALPRNDIMVLKYANIPSTMVEVGFLSNPTEAALLNQTEYQQKIAFAIYQGILRYYSGDDVPAE